MTTDFNFAMTLDYNGKPIIARVWNDLNTAKNQVDAMLHSRNINFSAVLVGPTVRDKWECDAWRVTLGKFTTDYYTGTGHRKMPANVKPNNNFGIKPKPTVPCAADVLYSLLSDASAADQSFGDWCADYGYDADSISALNTYQVCEKIGHEMRKLFDNQTRELFREVLQDY